MFISGLSLPRRTVLRGLGAALALPFLDAMVPAFVPGVRAAAKPAHRFLAFYVPNGMAMEYWSPKTVGKAFELSPILEPLAAYRDQMLVLSGINANWHYIHAGASGSFLTGTARGGRNEGERAAPMNGQAQVPTVPSAPLAGDGDDINPAAMAEVALPRELLERGRRAAKHALNAQSEKLHKVLAGVRSRGSPSGRVRARGR